MTSISSFGGCCGLVMAHGFNPGEPKNGKTRTWLREYRTKFTPGQTWFTLDDKTSAKNNCVIVLNGRQVEDLKEDLEAGGWLCVHKFVNHNYSDILFLYFCDTQPTKAPGHPKFDTSKYVEIDIKRDKRHYVLTHSEAKEIEKRG